MGYIFYIEDYTTVHEFRMFGEEYLRFKHFLVPNSFLHIKISGRKNYYNDDVRLQFTEIQLLHDVLNKLSKKVTIELTLDEVNKEKLASITSIINAHKGSKPLSFVVTDNQEKIKLNLPSRTHKVAISNELLSILKNGGFSFRLN